MNTGLLILRLAFGVALAAHGAQKLFGWWGGPGPRGLRDHLTTMRFRPAPLWVAGAIGTEIGGGLLLALGFLSPLGTVGAGAAMVMAIVAFHWGKGFFGQRGGLEMPLLYRLRELPWRWLDAVPPRSSRRPGLPPDAPAASQRGRGNQEPVR